jgi:hypothetical protein
MYNSEILDHLIAKYGIDDVIKFCEMESEKNALLADDFEKNKTRDSEPSEFSYERDWWSIANKQLKKRR